MSRSEWNRLKVGAAVKYGYESQVILRVAAVSKSSGGRPNRLTLVGPVGTLHYPTTAYDRYCSVIVKPKTTSDVES